MVIKTLELLWVQYDNEKKRNIISDLPCTIIAEKNITVSLSLSTLLWIKMSKENYQVLYDLCIIKSVYTEI